MAKLHQREVPLLSSLFLPFLCSVFYLFNTLITSTPRDFRANTGDNSEILWGGWKELRGIARAVREMMSSYTLPEKEFSVFSQIAE